MISTHIVFTNAMISTHIVYTNAMISTHMHFMMHVMMRPFINGSYYFLISQTEGADPSPSH